METKVCSCCEKLMIKELEGVVHTANPEQYLWTWKCICGNEEEGGVDVGKTNEEMFKDKWDKANSRVEITKHRGHNFLWIDNELWMSDYPAEVNIQERIASQAYGNVLVAGYGLGILQKYLDSNREVDYFVTIEKEQEVVDRCKETYGRIHGDVIVSDFFDYDHNAVQYTCVIGDIWPEIDVQYLPDYRKFHEKAEKFCKPDGKILGWGAEYFQWLMRQ